MQYTMLIFKSSYLGGGVGHTHKQKQPHKIHLGEAGCGGSHLSFLFLES